MKSRKKQDIRQAKRRRKARQSRKARFETLESRELLAVDAVPGQLLISFNGDLDAAERDQIVSDAGATVVKHFSTVGISLVEYDPEALTAEAQISLLESDSNVSFAEQNITGFTPDVTLPNDPLFSQMWGLHNVGQTPPGGTFDIDMNAAEAWDISIGDPDAVVAILDTGVDYTHPDLAANMWRNPGEIPSDGIDNDGNGYIDDIFGIDPAAGDSDPMDSGDHGTHVAGTVAAVGDNDTGVTGVTWNSKIMAISVLGAGGGSAASIIEGIDYMTNMKLNHGVNVVVSNNSYGSYTYSAAMEAAIDRSIQAGIPFIASAGNDGLDVDAVPHYPSGFALDGVFSVAATDKDDNLAGFSNYGLTSVDFGAPGVEIWSTVPLSVDPFGYQPNQGTSMSSPHVAGAVALLRSINPTLTVDQVKSILMGTVDPNTDLVGLSVSGGTVDLWDAITVLPSGAVEGMIWEDLNENGVRENNEPPLPGWQVYVDVNNNGVQDRTEQGDVTRADGSYSIAHYRGPGTYFVRQVVEPGFQQTFPGGGAPHSVTFTTFDQIITDVDFGNVQVSSSITGVKWIDTDLDGNYDVDDGERGAAGFTIYVDENDNQRLDPGEARAVTEADGSYELSISRAGTYKIREATPPGFTQTFPRGDGSYTVTIGQDEALSGYNFGNSGQMHDFGEAPDSYGTTLADDGPRHRILAGFGLGTELHGETDSANATVDDADGVSFSSRLVAGQTSSVDVNVMTYGRTAGYVNAWVDFDGDGTFADSEQVIANDRRAHGAHTISFSVPANAITGATWARVRYGWEYDMGPTGESMAGEVEDYQLNTFGDIPVANDDIFDGSNSVAQDSTSNPLDVLANDFASSAGGLFISSVQSPSNQSGTVTIAAGGQTVLYTPNSGFFGSDSFTYTIEDAAGRTDSATVQVVVAPTVSGPLANDDIHLFTDFPVNSFTDINVLLNDFNGPNGPLQLNRIVGAPASFGIATIFDNGTSDPSDDVIRYTPRDPNVAGNTDVFQYEVVDTLGNTATASVLVQIGDTTADDLVEITVGAFDLVTGNPIATIEVGQQFELRAFVNDKRPSIPSGGAELNGVFSAYFDVTVNKPTPDSNIFAATFVGQPTATANYPEAFNGDTLTPGQVDEAGGVQPVQIGGQIQGHGNGPIHIWSQTVRADAPGNLIFQPNPGDDQNLLTLLFDPPNQVGIPEIAYIPINIIANNPGSPEGEGVHNASMPGDVNNDGRVNAQDPLLLINKYVTEQAEGEETTTIKWDVTNDEKFNVSDIIAAINYFRQSHAAITGASAEGEFTVKIQPLGDPLAEPVLVVASPSNLSPMAEQRDDMISSRRVDGQVNDLGSPVDQPRYEARSLESNSIHDPSWKMELDSTLENEDLLDAISSDWESDGE